MKQGLNLFLSSCILMPCLTTAQEWVVKDSLKLNEVPTSISSDILGNFYLGFQKGSVIRYNSDFSMIDNYSLTNQSAITSIEAQNNLRLFLFQEGNQTITLLDRFGAVPKSYSLFGFGLEYVTYACPAVDQDIWTIEINPTRLKKIDILNNILKFEVQLQLGDSISAMRGFQNLLVISSEAGTYVLDQFGSVISTFETKHSTAFSVFEELGYLLNEQHQEVIYDLEDISMLNTINIGLVFQKGAYLREDRLVVMNNDWLYLLKRND